MSATLATLVNFNGADGANLRGDLTADSNGDLFGTTSGTVFEIAKTPTGYASTPTTLVTFDGGYSSGANAGLIADAKGDLFGTTVGGGADGYGTVFEIAKTPTGYASAPITLVSFSGTNGAYSEGGLIADTKGDLFGTTEQGGASGGGTVFEIAKTAGGYASTPTTLVSFNGVDGSSSYAGLIADAYGDLFGTTAAGGAGGYGTVFEIAKTAGAYASAPTTLVSFNETDGSGPDAGLIADAKGDLFGTTEAGGAAEYGTVFEIAKTAGGYASTPTTLVSFNGDDGRDPIGSLIADARGDLFGTTADGGDFVVGGTVFEIKKTAAGYASTPTTLVSFYHDVGSDPDAGLIADANGDLFGTTSGGGANSRGTVFEITGSGFVPPGSVAAPASDGILFWSTDGQAAIWGMDGTKVVAGGAVSPNPGPSWYTVGTGDFNDDGLPDILWQNASTGQASIWEMNGNKLIGGGPVSPNPGPSWFAVGIGDFNGDGHSDILWQNTSWQVAIWDMNGTKIIGGGAVSTNPGPSWYAIGLT